MVGDTKMYIVQYIWVVIRNFRKHSCFKLLQTQQLGKSHNARVNLSLFYRISVKMITGITRTAIVIKLFMFVGTVPPLLFPSGSKQNDFNCFPL